MILKSSSTDIKIGILCFFSSLIYDGLSRLVQSDLRIKLTYVNVVGHNHVRITIIEVNI